jgi:hypothetical protein
LSLVEGLFLTSQYEKFIKDKNKLYIPLLPGYPSDKNRNSGELLKYF